MNTMSDIDKIINVTRRAKARAMLMNTIDYGMENFNVMMLDLSGQMASTMLDKKYITAIFPDVHEQLVALRWYDIVLHMRLKTDGTE